MPLTADIVLGDRIKGLWCGDSGSGKTQGIGSFPGPMYVFDTDGRIGTIKKAFPNRKDIEYDYYTPFDYVKLAGKYDEIKAKPWKYATVVQDSLGSLCDMALNYSMFIRGRDESKKVGIIDMYSIADFGVESKAVKSIIDILVSIPCHTILTAHYYNVSEKKLGSDAEPTQVRHVVTGAQKLAAKVPGFYNEVWYFEVEGQVMIGAKPKFYVNTITRGINPARTSLPLDARFEFTDKSLFDIVKQKCESVISLATTVAPPAPLITPLAVPTQIK